MPYTASNAPTGTLPVMGSRLWAKVFNEVLRKTGDETKARQAAWGAIKNAGWVKSGDKWIKESCGGPQDENSALYRKTRKGETMRISHIVSLREGTVDTEKRRVKRVRIINADKRTKNGTYYPRKVLEAAKSLFEGALVFPKHYDDEGRSTREIVGKLEEVKIEPEGLFADLALSEAEGEMLTKINEGLITDMSLNGHGKSHIARLHGKTTRVIEAINKINSVDLVPEGSAGGKILEAFGKEDVELSLIDNMTLDELRKARPDLVEEMGKNADLNETTKTPEKPRKAEPEQEHLGEALGAMREEILSMIGKVEGGFTEKLETLIAKGEVQLQEAAKKQDAIRESYKVLRESNLPELAQERIRDDVVDSLVKGEDATKVIEAEREYLVKTTGGKLDATPGAAPDPEKERLTEQARCEDIIDKQLGGVIDKKPETIPTEKITEALMAVIAKSIKKKEGDK